MATLLSEWIWLGLCVWRGEWVGGQVWECVPQKRWKLSMAASLSKWSWMLVWGGGGGGGERERSVEVSGYTKKTNDGGMC